LRPVFRPFYNFIRGIPLNNGNYQDAEASASNGRMRAWGQKDLINGCAYLWVQNTNNTWKNALVKGRRQQITGTLSISGFQTKTRYRLEWWDPYQADVYSQVIDTDEVWSNGNGALEFLVEDLTADIAVKISPEEMGEAAANGAETPCNTAPLPPQAGPPQAYMPFSSGQ
jgi:hypothetical protein